MRTYLFLLIAAFTVFKTSKAVSNCTLCELDETYNEDTGYACFYLNTDQVACTCSDNRYTLDRPCRICDRPNICGDDSKSMCSEYAPGLLGANSSTGASFACFCKDFSVYYGKPCPSTTTLPPTTTMSMTTEQFTTATAKPTITG